MVNAHLSEFLRSLLPQSEESVALLLRNFENKKLSKGAHVLKEGNICSSFYFVESGHLRTFYTKKDVEINMHFHFEGSVTSDHRNGKAGIPSEFTIQAGEKSEIWTINRNTLTTLCYSNPDIMVFGRRLLNRLLLDLNAHSNLFKMYSPAERYHFIAKNNPQLLQRISLTHLASYLGINRRTLTRIRSSK